MANEGKKSFVFYYDYRQHLSLLTDEDRGRLLMALLDYGENGSEPDLDGAARMAFSFIATQMDRDAAKYAETVQKRREAGRQGGRPKANESNEKQTKAKKANGFSEKQTKAKKPDTDTVTDNVTDTVTDTDTDIYSPHTPQGGDEVDIQERRFAEFWKRYPRKVGKIAARMAWMRIKPTAILFDQIMAAVDMAKKSKEWTKEGGSFIPHPSTWLNQGRWDDELTPCDNNKQEGGHRSGEYRGRNERQNDQTGTDNETTLSGFRMADD